MRRAAAAAVAAALLLVPPAAAGWLTGGGGAGAAHAASLSAPGAPGAAVSGTLTKNVTLTWPAVPGATGYRVRRYGLLGELVAIGGTCVGTVAATGCEDTALALGSTWAYGVRAVVGEWVGPESVRTTVAL